MNGLTGIYQLHKNAELMLEGPRNNGQRFLIVPDLAAHTAHQAVHIQSKSL
jgi:hypothetical protein